MLVAILIGVFVLLLIVSVACRSAASSPNPNRASDLQAFRERQRQQQNEQRAARVQGYIDQQQQQQQNNTTPSSVEDTSRQQQVMKHLYHRTLEHGESVRSITMILAAANDSYNDSSENKGNIFSRSWKSAQNSVRTFRTSGECSICLQEYQSKETVCWAKNDDCDHLFHQDCIVTWLKDHDDCPLCRTHLLKYDNDEDSVMNGD